MARPADEVLEQIKEIRDTGRTNMFDKFAVQTLAAKNGYDDTVVWIEENEQDYYQLIRDGPD